MSKYAPLGDFLRRQPGQEVPMNFHEIERVIGAPLPPKAQNYAAWWSNNPSNNVMTKIWLEAGFRTQQVDLRGRRLVFRRASKMVAAKADPSQTKAAPAAQEGRHPLLGALRGTVTVMPGVDLAEPADPSWGKAWE